LFRHVTSHFKRLQRKIQAKTWWAPRPKDIFLDGDALSTAWLKVDCVICLGSLVKVHTDATGADPSVSIGPLADVALLRLPCGHVFHDPCASQWLLQEDACPLCRRVVGNLRQCDRLHLSDPSVNSKICKGCSCGWRRPEPKAPPNAV
jgi:hypothetical protein